MRGVHAAILALVVGAFVGASAPAMAESPLPTYDGGMSFPAIKGPSDPEEFSWEIALSDGQELQLADSQHAAVYYTEGNHFAFGISATAAHDAVGSDVPTSLAVSGENVIILTVHHRAGNPASGGAPFEYPVLAGAGWSGGLADPVIVKGPMTEQELREVRERIERENREARDIGGGMPPERCLVPRLKGLSLKASVRRLRSASCKIGRVGKRKGAIAKTGKVVTQSAWPGTALAPGAGISVTLGYPNSPK